MLSDVQHRERNVPAIPPRPVFRKRVDTVYEGLLRAVIQHDDYVRVHPDALESGMSATEHWQCVGRYSGRPPSGLIEPREWRGFAHRGDRPLLAWNRANGHAFPAEADPRRKYGLLSLLETYLRDSLASEWGHVAATTLHADELCRVFDPVFYGELYNDVPAHFGLRLRHYLRYGWIKKRRAAKGCSPDAVVDRLRHGRVPYGLADACGLSATPLGASARDMAAEAAIRDRFTPAQVEALWRYFDSDLFAESLGLRPGRSPALALLAYLDGGWRIMPDTRSGFDSDAYLEAHPDARESGMSPLEHFVIVEAAPKPVPRRLDPDADIAAVDLAQNSPIEAAKVFSEAPRGATPTPSKPQEAQVQDPLRTSQELLSDKEKSVVETSNAAKIDPSFFKKRFESRRDSFRSKSAAFFEKKRLKDESIYVGVPAGFGDSKAESENNLTDYFIDKWD